jgi:hypothetical protein
VKNQDINHQEKKKHQKMIEERFLESAVKIKKKYISLVSNLELYRTAASSLNTKLNTSLENLQTLEEDYKNHKIQGKEAMNSILEIINKIESDGKRLENLINPINEEIELLAKEEQFLFKQIVDTHPNLTQKQIIQIVKDRIIKEGLPI